MTLLNTIFAANLKIKKARKQHLVKLNGSMTALQIVMDSAREITFNMNRQDKFVQAGLVALRSVKSL